MPRPALRNVSTVALQAELQCRAAQLGKLLRLRELVDKDIAELQGLAGRFGQAVAAEAGKKVATKPAAAKPRKAFKQTAQRFILRLLKGGAMTTAQLNERWARIGRGGKADKVLGEMVAAGTLKREKLKVGKGSEYRVA